MQDVKEIILSVVLSTFFGGATSSMSAVRKKVTIGQALVATGFGCLVSASIPFGLMALGVHWGVSIPLAVAAGLLIFGILAWADRQETKLPNYDLHDVIPGLPKPHDPPKSQPPTPQEPPQNDKP